MGLKEVDRAEINPMLEVKRVPLDDGLHASLILENGCISKLVLPSGEVAVLKWEGKQDSPRPSSPDNSTTAGPRCTSFLNFQSQDLGNAKLNDKTSGCSLGHAASGTCKLHTAERIIMLLRAMQLLQARSDPALCGQHDMY